MLLGQAVFAQLWVWHIVAVVIGPAVKAAFYHKVEFVGWKDRRRAYLGHLPWHTDHPRVPSQNQHCCADRCVNLGLLPSRFERSMAEYFGIFGLAIVAGGADIMCSLRSGEIPMALALWDMCGWP